MNIIDKVKVLPKDTKLYSPLLGEVTYKYCTDVGICVDTKIGQHCFHANGSYFSTCGDCLLFPSKECQSWNHLFKKGDIIVSSMGLLAMFEKYGNDFAVYYSSFISPINNDHFKIEISTGIGRHEDCRLATLDEKEKFFKLFKERYNLIWDGNKFVKNVTFDFNSFKPFDQVLVRQRKDALWKIDFFEEAFGHRYRTMKFPDGVYLCIPYNEDTQHLINTCHDAPEFYRE
jgi:hypothetical protein